MSEVFENTLLWINLNFTLHFPVKYQGLAVTYTINLVLAVLAAFKAGERGQPTLLWVAKTFSVGGLAYDQLTQLPTVEEGRRSRI